MPEIELIDPDDKLRIEFKSAEGVVAIVAHKEESKNIWLREIKQYLKDAVALQEHSIDDIRIDPKQHIDIAEQLIKLPQRIEAYETDQNIKPSDVAEAYTISKYSTKKVSEEVTTTKTANESIEIKKTEKTEESSQQVQKSSAPVKEPSKIPVFKKQSISEEKPEEVKKTAKPVISPQPPKEQITVEIKPEVVVKKEQEPAQKVEQVKAAVEVKEPEVVKKPEEPKKTTEIKPVPKVEEQNKQETKPEVTKKEEERKKVEEKPTAPVKVEEPKKVQQKVSEVPKTEEKPKSLPELKTEIVRKAPVELPPVAKVEKPIEETKVTEIKKEDPLKSELSVVEQSVSEKLDKLSQKLRSIRKTEVDKEISKFIPKEAPEVLTETEKSEEEIRRQEAIKEEIQEKIEEDYISENSVIRRIEERYKKNYKEKYTAKGKKALEEQVEIQNLVEDKPAKTKPAPLTLPKEDQITKEKLPKVTKAADSGDSKDNQSPPKENQDNNNNNNSDNNQSNDQQDQPSTPPQRSNDNNRDRRGSGDKERSPPTPGSIRLPGFFDPPPPQKYEASIEIQVKKEKYPDPPPKITRKVVVKNDELEKKTEEFLRGDLPYEKEDFSLISAQQKIKNLKHNLGKTTDTIKFAEDTVSKAILGDFSHIKTPGTVVPERKKEPVFEYQYTVEDPKTGVCITTSEAVDFEDAEEDLIKLAKMEAEHKMNVTSKKVEGKQFFILKWSAVLETIIYVYNFLHSYHFLRLFI